jgi:flagellar basal body-associated protein FliL
MAEEKEAAPAQPEAAPAAKGGKKSNMLVWLIIAAIVVLEFPVMFFLIKATRPKSPEEIAAAAQTDSLKIVATQKTTMGATTEDPIEAVVNIAGTDGERFLKISVVFEYDNVKYPLLAEELTRRAPRLKSMLIEHLSKIPLMQLNEPSAQDDIRGQLLRTINASMPVESGQILSVLFDSFLIQ